MDISIKLIPGYTFQPGELITVDKLNALGNPTFEVSDTVTGTFSDTDGSITTAMLETNILECTALGWSKMQDGYVITSKLATSPPAVTEATIAGGAVSSGKLAADAVTTAKILDGAVTFDKLDPDVFGTAPTTPAAIITDSAVLVDATSKLTKIATLTAIKALLSAGAGQVKANLGNYTGSATVTVSGVGFMPDVVLMANTLDNGFLLGFNGHSKLHPSWDNGGANGASITYETDGFKLTSSGPGNTNGRSYRYLAIAVST